MTITIPNLLAISGSIRKASVNTALLQGLAGAVAGRANVTLFPLNEVPLYDGDLDGDAPPAPVVALKSVVAAADGLVISSPEYNYSISGVLKNAFDWISRPHGKSPLQGKIVLTMTASPAFTGGARAQAHLHDVITAIGARVLLRPQTVVAAAHQKVGADGSIDPDTLKFLSAGVDDLLLAIARDHAATT